MTNKTTNDANNLMTKEEVIEKYSDTLCYFNGYYKHTFEFVGYDDYDKNGVTKIIICIGGCSEDIYKLNINPGTTFKINDESVILIHITRGDRTLYQESRI